MTRTKTRAAAAIIAAVALPLTLAACGSSDTPAPASSSASPAATETMVGTSPATWSPLELTLKDDGTTVEMVPEQVALITGLPTVGDNITLMSDDPAVVEVMQGDGVTMNRGFAALKPGHTTVTVWSGFPADGEAEKIMSVTVHVADKAGDAGMVGGDPATWSPVEVTQMDNGKTYDLKVGQRGVFTEMPADDANNNIVVESDNPEVVKPVQGDGTTSLPGFEAVAPGTATLIVWDGFPADRGDAIPVEQITVTVK